MPVESVGVAPVLSDDVVDVVPESVEGSVEVDELVSVVPGSVVPVSLVVPEPLSVDVDESESVVEPESVPESVVVPLSVLLLLSVESLPEPVSVVEEPSLGVKASSQSRSSRTRFSPSTTIGVRVMVQSSVTVPPGTGMI